MGERLRAAARALRLPAWIVLPLVILGLAPGARSGELSGCVGRGESWRLQRDVSAAAAALQPFEERLPGELRAQLPLVVAEESRAEGWDPRLLVALMEVESSYRTTSVSSAGAVGLVQVRPPTLRWMLERSGLPRSLEDDPATRVRMGARYLGELQDRFGDLELALVAYNAGPARVRRWRRAGRARDPLGYARRIRTVYERLTAGDPSAAPWETLSSAGGEYR